MAISFTQFTGPYGGHARFHRQPRVRLSDSTSTFLLHRQPRMTQTATVGQSSTLVFHRAPRVRSWATVGPAEVPTGTFLLHRAKHVDMDVTYPADLVFHRRPRLRMSDQVGGFLLHRQPRVSMTAEFPAAIQVHRQPRVRLLGDQLTTAIPTWLMLHRQPRVFIGEASPTPEVTAFILFGPPHRVRMEATITYPEDMQFHRQPRVLLVDDGARFVLHRQPRVYLFDGVLSLDRNALLMQQPMMTGSAIAGMTLQMNETMALRAAREVQEIWLAAVTMAVRGQTHPALDGLALLNDGPAFNDVARQVLMLLFADAFKVSTTATRFAQAVSHMVDALALTAGPGSWLDARDTVAAALPLHDASLFVWPAVMQDAFGLADADAHGLLAAQQVLDKLALQAVPAGHASMAVLVDDALTLDDTLSHTAELFQHIRDGLEVLATFTLPDGTQYTAWVLHGDTRSFTSYSNFPFNSFCELAGHYYGATDTGLYLLEGDDDAGEPIEARVRGGLSDMGTGRLKRMQALYLGYRADGPLMLKVVTTSDEGEKREDWYQLDAQPASVVREGRIKIGKGLKSRYWGFEIANVAGGDFALDELAWLPMMLDRRV